MHLHLRMASEGNDREEYWVTYFSHSLASLFVGKWVFFPIQIINDINYLSFSSWMDGMDLLLDWSGFSAPDIPKKEPLEFEYSDTMRELIIIEINGMCHRNASMSFTS